MTKEKWKVAVSFNKLSAPGRWMAILYLVLPPAFDFGVPSKNEIRITDYFMFGAVCNAGKWPVFC